MSLRRKAWVSDCRVMEVKREIPRQHAMLIYILKQSLIARPEKHHVVRNAGPGAVDTEMDKEKAGRPSLALQYFGLETATDGVAEQIELRAEERRGGKKVGRRCSTRRWELHEEK